MQVPRSLVECLLWNSLQFPDRRALLDVGPDAHNPAQTWLTWPEIAHTVFLLTQWLADQQLGPQSLVVSILPNSTEWIALDLACHASGVIHAPIDPRYPEALRNSLLDLVQPNLVVHADTCRLLSVSGRTWPAISSTQLGLEIANQKSTSVPDSVESLAEFHCGYLTNGAEDETATILFTSGTTDSPKGVMLSHRNLLSNAKGKLHAMPQFSTDRRVNFLPFTHSYARTCELSTWLVTGGELILSRRMEQVVALSQKYSPTLINGVPLFFDALRTESACNPNSISIHNYLGGSIRQLASGGAALTSDTATFFDRAQLPILVGYGLTEASPVVCSNFSTDGRTDNVGPAIPGVKIRVDSEGELYVSGSGVMQGYFGNPTATSNAIIDNELRTGDLAEIDSTGRVRLLGRIRDTIILSSGVKIAPYQVEKSLKSISGIEDAVVVGEGWERCAAIVVVSSALWYQLSNCQSHQRPEILTHFQRSLDTLPKYANPTAWVIRKLPFSHNPNLINHKGAPRREMIRLQYESSMRESIRSGIPSLILDADG